jgi:ketosteroid isomerase-like protein
MTTPHAVIELEQAALARWCSGDPSGFLDISAEDVVYFDPFLPARLDGLDQLSSYYESIRGKVFAPHYEMIDPNVKEIDNVAILTFRFISYSGSEGLEMRWNCTEVYRRESGGWKIVQTHWSFTGKDTQ